jgi:hypothetical protein
MQCIIKYYLLLKIYYYVNEFCPALVFIFRYNSPKSSKIKN